MSKARIWTASAVSPESNWIPIIRPLPRTSFTSAGCRSSSGRSASWISRPRIPALAIRPFSSRRMVSRTAASETGLPPNVLPCAPGPQVIRPAFAIIAPTGIPDPMPFAVSRMSGSTSQCWIAHILPVRPAPDWTSSAMSRIPWRSHSSRSRGRKSSSGTT